jgi:hypothetical protein
MRATAKASTGQHSTDDLARPQTPTVTSSPVSQLVKNSQFFQASTDEAFALASFVRLHTLTFPSIPPVATNSPSAENPEATTESVCPVSRMGSKVELSMALEVEGVRGEKMKPRSSSPPEMARGGLGN